VPIRYHFAIGWIQAHEADVLKRTTIIQPPDFQDVMSCSERQQWLYYLT
jgi:hypothetical protein